MASDSLEKRICDALTALLDDHHEDGSVVLIQELWTGKFVQFGPGWSLILDVPCVALTSAEADRVSRFFAGLGEKYPIEYDAPNPRTARILHGATFNHDFGQDACTAAQAAVAFFREAYLMFDDTELKIERR